MTLRYGLTAGLVCAVISCKPTISSFCAEPNVTCAGSTVRLSWVASSGGELLSTPADAKLGSVDASGTTAATPKTATRYRFVSENMWGTAIRDVDVEVQTAPVGSKQIGASIADPSATCLDGTLALTVNAPAKDWSAQMHASTVEVPSNVARRYHVEHGNAKADLDPGVPSSAFAGLPVQGEWRISTPLEAGEACGKKLPRSLTLLVTSTCSP